MSQENIMPIQSSPLGPDSDAARQKLEMYQVVLLLVFGSESILFGTLLSAFLFTRSTLPAAAGGGFNWARLALPVGNSLILLISLFFTRSAARVALQGSQAGTRQRLWMTILLGLIFIAGQVFEFSRSGMRLDDPALGGMYFALIGFHALHVVAGMVILALVLIRAYLGDFWAGHAAPVRDGYWFWIYVTAVWAVLFFALYIL